MKSAYFFDYVKGGSRIALCDNNLIFIELLDDEHCRNGIFLLVGQVVWLCCLKQLLKEALNGFRAHFFK